MDATKDAETKESNVTFTYTYDEDDNSWSVDEDTAEVLLSAME